jgi:hypothetical protein
MPAFRRFLAHALPRCFASTEDDAASIREAVRTPSQLGGSGAKKGSKRKSTLPSSLFDTTMNKTVDTRVEATKPDDDELQLVAMEASGQGSNSVADSTEGARRGSDSLYNHQQTKAMPRDW